MYERDHLYIGGEWVAPEAGGRVDVVNPATEAVIGHAPRHLDRNIALVGRVIDGIDKLSSLPRGTEHSKTTGIVLGRLCNASASRSGDIATTPSTRPRIARIAVSIP